MGADREDLGHYARLNLLGADLRPMQPLALGQRLFIQAFRQTLFP